MTKTAATVEIYLIRGNQLWMRAAISYGITPEKLLASIFLDWLEGQLPELRPASRRQYIASSKELLNEQLIILPANSIKITDQNESIARALIMKSSGYSTPEMKKPKPRRGKTSSQKAKRINVEDIRMLRDATKGSRSQWVLPALLWLTVNITVGLRPNEWRYAKLIKMEGQHFLRINNGKATNGRAHGILRHINVSGLLDIEMQWLKLQLRNVQQYAESDTEWLRYYTAVRRVIYEISRKHLGNRRKYPTLYGGRHQFAANAKLEGLTKAEIAAMMGHATDQTATHHYGKKSYGKGGCRCKPLPEEVDKVKRIDPDIKIQPKRS